MIAAAVKYRQAEKNTPPDFTTNPPSLRNSVFCQKAPKNSQLKGLVQAQDPANNPNLFFDPATGATVTLGSQPNTLPFGANDRVDPPMHANNTKVDGPANNTGNKASGNTAMGHNGKKPMDKAGDNVPNDAGNKNATAAGNIGNFGSCSVPQIEFGQGFDGRKETSFRPVDQSKCGGSYPLRVMSTETLVNFRILHPRFGPKYRCHHPVHVRPAREHLQG